MAHRKMSVMSVIVSNLILQLNIHLENANLVST